MTNPEPQDDDSPTPNEVDRAENVKHLEMIQAIVTRLASNSFFIKGWTLTVAAAAYGFAVNRIDWRLAATGSFVVLGFWVLDSYYLRQERLFRHLYNHVRRNINVDSHGRFSMNLVPFAQFSTIKRRTVFLSVTLVTYYPVLMLAGIGLSIALPTTSGFVMQAPNQAP